MELQKKVAWITGGTRMGLTVARLLAAQGCQIVLTWKRSRQPALDAVQELQSEGLTAWATSCDLAKPASIEKTIQHIQRQSGRLDILVNLASMYEPAPVASPGPWKILEQHLLNNTQSAYAVTALAAALMRRSGGGRVIHIADWTSTSGRPRYNGYSAYYISKKAVQGVVECLALELAPHILVNAIAPGPILPPKGMTSKEDLAVRRATPLGKWGGPEEIAKAVLFLIQTDFVTGETIRVDGGRHLN